MKQSSGTYVAVGIAAAYFADTPGCLLRTVQVLGVNIQYN